MIEAEKCFQNIFFSLHLLIRGLIKELEMSSVYLGDLYMVFFDIIFAIVRNY